MSAPSESHKSDAVPAPSATSMHYFELTRLHKFPLGNILVIWPCLWALGMAAYKQGLELDRALALAAVFTLGGTLVHSTACVLNDICDIDFDRQVERTKYRPLASGVLPLRGAWILLTVMTAMCIGIISLTNSEAALVGLFGIFPLHGLYPLMKRWTYWPQAWLGFAMNWGFPVAWLTVTTKYDPVDLPLLAIFIAGSVCWTIVYDTEYACQDRKHNAQAGVKSTALLFGDSVRGILAIFAIFFVASLIAIGIINGHTAIYFAMSCGGAAAHFAWQLITWNVEDPADCGAKFKANGDIGYIIWAGILLDCALAKVTQ